MQNYFIDKQYIHKLKSYFPTLSQNSDDVFNVRCPICGDSAHNQTKKRGYFYRNKTRKFKYKCFNCGVNIPFFVFLKNYCPNVLYREYIFDKFNDSIHNKKSNDIDNTFIEDNTKEKFSNLYKLPNCIPIVKLDNNHIAKQYILSRQIPSIYYNDIFYSEDFKLTIENISDNYKNIISEPRLVIPFFDTSGNIFALQGRSLDENPKLKYITIRFDKTDIIQKPYGINRYDKSKLGYVVEGPIDSLFLPNSLAVASSNLTNSFVNTLDKSNIIIVFDNECRNNEIIKKMESAIFQGYQVCIWDNKITQKDINDMVISGIDVVNIINNSTYSGLKGLLKLQEWKRFIPKNVYKNKKRNYRDLH